MHLYGILLNRQEVPVAVDCLELCDQHPHLLCCCHEAQDGPCIRLKAYHTLIKRLTLAHVVEVVCFSCNEKIQ